MERRGRGGIDDVTEGQITNFTFLCPLLIRDPILIPKSSNPHHLLSHEVTTYFRFHSALIILSASPLILTFNLSAAGTLIQHN